MRSKEKSIDQESKINKDDKWRLYNFSMYKRRRKKYLKVYDRYKIETNKFIIKQVTDTEQDQAISSDHIQRSSSHLIDIYFKHTNYVWLVIYSV